MRKSISLILALGLVFGLCACGKTENSGENPTSSVAHGETQTSTKAETTTPQETTTKALSVEEKRAAAKPNKDQAMLHFYKTDDDVTFERVDSYANTWLYYHDIICVYGFLSEADSIPFKDYATSWLADWNACKAAAITKIGYEVKVGLNNGTEYIDTLKKPEDTAEIFDYVECYLYDDVHQKPGVWYSHLLPSDVGDATLMTSLKLTTGKKIEDVKSIDITMFTYTSDQDFDTTTGRYIGGNYIGLNIGKITD